MATTARSERSRPDVLRMCHQRKTTQRLVASQVKSIFVSESGQLGGWFDVALG
jgi:hypothetical protein